MKDEQRELVNWTKRKIDLENEWIKLNSFGNVLSKFVGCYDE